MNLQAVLGIVRAAGLCVAISLVGCDSGEKKAEEKTAEEGKVGGKAEEKKAAPEEKKAEVAEMKAADPAANAGDPGANAGAGGNADPAKAAGDAKAEGDAKADEAEGDAKAGDAKAADAKGDGKKADGKKAEDKKGDGKKAEDKTAGIDGKALYDAKCKVCHAADGKGTEAMKKNNVPDMSAGEWQSKHGKAAIVKAIADGVDGTKMKAFKDKLKPEEIEAIAAYVKKLK